MALYTAADDLKNRTTDFMHALAASDVDAANISADTNGVGMMVHAYIPDDEIDAAESIATDYGFTLYGAVDTAVHTRRNQAAAEGRTRYRFETTENTQ